MSPVRNREARRTLGPVNHSHKGSPASSQSPGCSPRGNSVPWAHAWEQVVRPAVDAPPSLRRTQRLVVPGAGDETQRLGSSDHGDDSKLLRLCGALSPEFSVYVSGRLQPIVRL
jgi:hypothetical protein